MSARFEEIKQRCEADMRRAIAERDAKVRQATLREAAERMAVRYQEAIQTSDHLRTMRQIGRLEVLDELRRMADAAEAGGDRG